MIIDCHTHVFSPRVQQDRGGYVGRDACFAALYSDPKARIINADELVAAMDAGGIDISVIASIGWATPALCAEANDYMIESVARFPKRLIGLGAVLPGSPEANREIERCARGGLKGIGELRPDIQGFDLADTKTLTPFTQALIDNDLVLLTHASEPVGHVYPGKGQVTPERLYAFLTAFPGLRIICAHWGGGLPFYALMPEVKKALANVYFDTAASPFLYAPQIYKTAVGLVGAEKILFGSDYPLLAPARLLKEIESVDLSPADKGLILAGNARRLFNVKEA
jgi:hypothetical protein